MRQRANSGVREKMAFETVRVIAGGTGFTGWTAVRVTAQKGAAARLFRIDATEVSHGFARSAFDVWHFPPGTPIQVRAGSDLLVDGYVEKYLPAATPQSHSVGIEGQGRSADYYISSWKHATGRFEDKTLLQIAQELDVFGIGVIAKGVSQLPLVPWFQLRMGSTPWAEMMRLLPQQQLTMTGQADGSLAIERGSTGRHGGGLVQGRNMLDMQAEISSEGLASEYRVVGQSAIGTTDEELRPEGTAQDGTLGRFRRRTIVDPAETSRGRATSRANWEKLRARGVSARAVVTAPGWRDEGGRLWEPGNLVYVHSSWLKLDQDMAISAVDFVQDERGTVSRLDLVDPRAFGDAGGRSGSGEIWRYKDDPRR